MLVGLFFIKSSTFPYAEPKSFYEWDYGIVEDTPMDRSTEYFVDKDNTSLVIDHNKKEIRLHRENGRNPIQFTNEDNNPIAYSVMTEEGILQFAFDGEKMVEVGSLKIEVENPLAFATKSNSPDISVISSPDGKDDFLLEYYGYDGLEMIGIPFLEIGGLKDIRSMGFLKDGTMGILKEDALNVYGSDGSSLERMPFMQLEKLENPLDMASDGEYNISILSEEKITQYSFDGYGLVEIPSLSIVLSDLDKFKNPRYIAAANGRTTIIDEANAYTFMRGSDQMHYAETLSVTKELNSPMGLAIHKNSNDIIILDEKEDNPVIRYYMTSDDGLTEIPQLSMELEGIVLSGGMKYDLKGVLITKPFEIQNNIVDMIQAGIYSTLEEDTEIKLFAYNGYEKDMDMENEKLWKPLWKIIRNKDEEKPTLYKNIGNAEGEEWEVYKEGSISEIYPINLKKDLAEKTKVKDDEYVVVEDDEGGLHLNPDTEVQNSQWLDISMPKNSIDLSKDSYIRLKIEFTSKEGKRTPKVFVPSDKNFIENITDDVAIKILARRKTLVPVIDDIVDNDLPEPEFPDFPGRKTIDGWVYTTTPNITWHLPVIDRDDYVDGEYQSAYQIIIMAEKDGGYIPALVTDIIDFSNVDEPIEKIRCYRIPTSTDPSVEGPLYASGSYSFSAYIRIWDDEGNPSSFSLGKRFNVLAFDRPRIIRIESTPGGGMNNPMVIEEGMEKEELLKAKAGTAITFAIDAVGPVENDMETDDDISIFYYVDDGKTDEYIKIDKGHKNIMYSSGNPVNRYTITTWTNAPVTEIKDGTIIKTHLWGESSIGGTTIMPIPKYADGIVEINSTVYQDWEVFLDGRKELLHD